MHSANLIESLESRRLLSASLSNGILTVLGTASNDTLTFERNGSDLIVRMNGERDDFTLENVRVILIDVGTGADSVILGNRNIPTHVRGGRGNDTISGSDAKDTLYGEGGDDYIYGNAGNDVIDGGGEADTLLGGSGKRDLVNYSSRLGNLTVDLSGDATDDGESGENDSVFTDIEIILGGNGNDNLSTKSSKQCTLAGGDGDDTLTGGSSGDVFDGGDGNDLMYGNAGNDKFLADDDPNQPDTIFGGSGDDIAIVDDLDEVHSATVIQ